ncbi:hypothetical protein, conserved [Trypanosoma cruzi]|uniref:Uncharacterized protein n=2 Tax=Trypanosoma cruzi TaxID=5693 RepID=Q4D486_TRYCC|nr:hypothetical protein, conserved [Trypanosoma cruzi]EAN87342.1 hypothetical protein, conserved [Trypanosoma cruzi]|eukprot:XP_809193.1 hypothetical protein [Trypanosoma cruzi strain CL Brener]
MKKFFFFLFFFCPDNTSFSCRCFSFSFPPSVCGRLAISCFPFSSLYSSLFPDVRMRPAHRCTAERREGMDEEKTQPSHPWTREDSLTAQLKIQLYRIYASVSRQREWFKIHESNVRALTEEAETLRARFFPHERSLLTAVTGDAKNRRETHSSSFCFADTEGMSSDDMTLTTMRRPCPCSKDASHAMIRDFSSRALTPWCPSSLQADEGWTLPLRPGGDGTGYPSAAVLIPSANDVHSCVNAVDFRHVVPEYLLQLSPGWIHERLGTTGGGKGGGIMAEEATSALVALLLPLLRAFRGVVDTARWLTESCDYATGVPAHDGFLTLKALCAAARHLFYLLHEALCCLSSWATEVAQSGMATVAHKMSPEERAEATQILLYLLDDRGSGALVLQLLCTDKNTSNTPHHTELGTLEPATTGFVPRSVVSEAFSFLAIHFFGICLGE